MLIRSTIVKNQILFTAFSLRVLLKEFGNDARMWMLEENQFPKLKNGTENSNRLTKNLVKMVKEFLVLPNIIYQKINIQKTLNSIYKNQTLNSISNVLLVFFH